MLEKLKDIYFYDAQSLAQELKRHTLSEHRAVKHLVAATIIGGIGFKFPVSIESSATVYDSYASLFHALFYIVLGIISYLGVWLTYQVNSKGDGKDYFLRFAVLALPVGVQLIVLFLLVGMVLAVISGIFLSEFGVSGSIVVLLLFYIASLWFYILFFLRMRRYIALAAGVSQ